jgi:hypothetical protein
MSDPKVREDDPWTFIRPRSPEQLLGLRKEAELTLSVQFLGAEWTCEDCLRKAVCVKAYDPRNLDYHCSYTYKSRVGKTEG